MLYPYNSIKLISIPDEPFAQAVLIPDSFMWLLYELERDLADLETNLEEEEVHPPHNNNPRQLELTFIFSWDYRKVEDIFHNYKNLVEDLFIILVVPLLVMVGQRLWHNIGSYCLLPTLDLSYASWRCLHHLSLGK